jgi:hypothetical protein
MVAAQAQFRKNNQLAFILNRPVNLMTVVSHILFQISKDRTELNASHFHIPNIPHKKKSINRVHLQLTGNYGAPIKVNEFQSPAK